MHADVAEMADATDLGSVTLRGVEVQILSSAHLILDIWIENLEARIENPLGPWPSGKAPALHAGDRRFESGRVHLKPMVAGQGAAMGLSLPFPVSGEGGW